MRVVVVDDHPLFRAGVIQALQGQSGLQIVGEGDCAADAVDLVRRHSPEILLLDLDLPGGGLNAVQAITSSFPDTKILILTVSQSEENAAAALKHGARAYVLKGVGGSKLVGILKAVMEGEIFVSPPLAGSRDGNSTRPSVD